MRSGAVVATILVWAFGAAPAHAHTYARSSDFDKGWKFALVNPNGITDPTGAFANAQDPAYDDTAWRSLDLPHDWSIELDPTDARGANTNSGTGFLQGGLGSATRAAASSPQGGRATCASATRTCGRPTAAPCRT
jgi:beta-galactosidase